MWKRAPPARSLTGWCARAWRTQLIGVCTAAKDFTAAEGIFVEMRDKGVKPKSATYLRFIYACFRQREADKAYDMLVNMENEWRVPDRKDYARMLNQFKWFEHSEGKMRCVRRSASTPRPPPTS